VGPVRWLGPSTERVIRRLGERGETRVLVVPIAFTSDHIETLSELDREYGELAHRVGITQYRRASALNDRPAFIDAIADLASEHLRSGEVCSTQYPFHCPGCVNPQCRNVLNPVGEVGSSRVAGEVRP
jgi:ferrochelatase